MPGPDLQHYLDELLTAYTVLDLHFSLAASLLLGIGLLLLLLALRRLFQRRLLSAGLQGLCSACFLLLALSALLLALNFHTYHRLTYEKPLLTLTFTAQGPQRFHVRLEYLDTDPAMPAPQAEFLLAGDEWQVDARILRWKPALQLLGLNAHYRLERLSGRYRSINDETSRPRSVYALADDRGLDIWALGQQLQLWVDWIDAYYGSAAYLPMADGAEYTLVITQSGLLARAANPAAEQALRTW